jgi:hypothetical protein
MGLGRSKPQEACGKGNRQQNRRSVCFHGAARTRFFLALVWRLAIAYQLRIKLSLAIARHNTNRKIN